MIVQEQLRLGTRLPPQPALPVRHAALVQLRVQFRQVPHLRHGHEVVQPRELHQAFHHALLVAPRHPAEVMGKEIVTFELKKPPRQLPFPAEDLTDRHRRVVVGDPPGHPAEELARPRVPLPERLRALALERHHKRRVAIRQRHHEEGHLAQPPVHLGQRVAEVHLRLPGRMGQRHEHLLALLRQLPHRVLHHRVAAREAGFPQPFPDPFGRVPLLARQGLVLLQDLLDPFQERPQLLPRSRLLLPVARRLAVRQDLPQRPPVHPRLPQNLPPAHPLHQHPPPNLAPLVHIAIHASSLLKLPHF